MGLRLGQGNLWLVFRLFNLMGRVLVYDDNFSNFSSKLYVVTPHLNRLIETVQLKGHNICFYAELTKIIPIITKYSLLSRALLRK